jgi:hypothetical protein
MSADLSTATTMAVSIFPLRIGNVKPRLRVGAFIFRVKDIKLPKVIDAQATAPNVDDATRAPFTTGDP